MCRTGDLKQDWKRSPDSAGEWLWVCCFTCGCVTESGFCLVERKEDIDEDFIDHEIGDFAICFEPQKPSDPQYIDAWLKVTMPTEAWFDLKTEDPQGDYPPIKEPA